jgi:hypothetical protein
MTESFGILTDSFQSGPGKLNPRLWLAAKLAAKTIDLGRLAAIVGGPPAAPTHTRPHRPAGDGSVCRTDDGRWRGVVDVGLVDGKRKRKYVSGPTQAEALGKLRQAQREAEAGVVPDDRMTVGHFLARWSTVNLPGQVSGTTLDDYTHTVRLHLGPALGHKRLARLTVGDVDKLWATWTSCGRPNGTPAGVVPDRRSARIARLSSRVPGPGPASGEGFDCPSLDTVFWRFRSSSRAASFNRSGGSSDLYRARTSARPRLHRHPGPDARPPVSGASPRLCQPRFPCPQDPSPPPTLTQARAYFVGEK